MLQSIREKAQGWIAWAIVIMISIPFALWGIQSYLGGGSAAVMVTVNDRDITEREFENDYHRFRQQLRQRMGGSYRPDLLDDKLLRKEMLASVIKSELIYQQAIGLGLRTSDEVLRDVIKSTPIFQVGGKFSNAAYENAARRMGLSTDGLESQMRQQLVSKQLSRAISASEIVTQAELEETLRLKDQKRKMSYIVVPADNYLVATEINPEEIDSYYQGNRSSFMSPERVKLEYLELDIKNLADTIKVEEEDLRGYYEQNRKDYLVPEQRRASHILITVDDSADQGTKAKARAAAEAALKRIKSGEKFASVAKALSQDTGSANAGGDLGFFGKGIMAPAFEKAVFALKKGDPSGLVKTEFGYHIIKLTDIRPEHGKSFEQVRDDLAETYRKEEAGRQFYEHAERLADLTYEDPDSLEPAAEALGLKVKKSDWIGRDGGEGALGNGRVISAAFSEDVLMERHNSELLELGPEHVLVLRVVEHQEPQVRPLQQVRSDIELMLKKRAASKLAEQKGKEIIAALKQGLSMQQAATKHKAQLKPAVEAGRDSKQVPAEILQTLFKMPRSEGKNMVYGETGLANGDYAVIALQKVVDGSEGGLTDDDKSKLRASMERLLGDANFDHMIENMRDRSDVVIPQEEK